MNELESSKIPMILGTQYFFALLREDKDTFEAVIQQTAELSKEEVFEFIKYFSANLIYMYDALCCLLYTSPSPRDGLLSRMPSSA